MILKLENNEETWEMLHLASSIHTVGNPLPMVEFDFVIDGVSEHNAYCSNEGIARQIKETLELNPQRTHVVYFYYKRNSI